MNVQLRDRVFKLIEDEFNDYLDGKVLLTKPFNKQYILIHASNLSGLTRVYSYCEIKNLIKEEITRIYLYSRSTPRSVRPPLNSDLILTDEEIKIYIAQALLGVHL